MGKNKYKYFPTSESRTVLESLDSVDGAEEIANQDEVLGPTAVLVIFVQAFVGSKEPQTDCCWLKIC